MPCILCCSVCTVRSYATCEWPEFCVNKDMSCSVPLVIATDVSVNYNINDHEHVSSCIVLPAKSDSDAMLCLQNYLGLRIDRSLVY